MRFSKKCEYALFALVHLGRQSKGGNPVLIRKIAEQEKIPKKFLENILFELKKRGIVVSVRGSGGGYRLISQQPGDPVPAHPVLSDK